MGPTCLNSVWAGLVIRIMQCMYCSSTLGNNCDRAGAWLLCRHRNMLLIVTWLLLVVERNQGQLQGRCLASSRGSTCRHTCQPCFMPGSSAVMQSAGACVMCQVGGGKNDNLGTVFKENNVRNFSGERVSIWTSLKNMCKLNLVSHKRLNLNFWVIWWINKRSDSRRFAEWINPNEIHLSRPLGQTRTQPFHFARRYFLKKWSHLGRGKREDMI